MCLFLGKILLHEHKKTVLVTEFCAGGDLSHLISQRKEMRMRGKRDAYLDSSFVIKVFRQLLSALKALHGNEKVTTAYNNILKSFLEPDSSS